MINSCLSYSNLGGLAHLFDVSKYAMLDFAPGESHAAAVAALLQCIHPSLLITYHSCDAVGVVQVEQDNS